MDSYQTSRIVQLPFRIGDVQRWLGFSGIVTPPATRRAQEAVGRAD